MIIIILEFWLSIGIIIICLKTVKGQNTKISDLFQGLPYLASYTGAYVLYTLLVMTGFFLLVVPGVVWHLKYMFFPYFVIEKKMKAIEALKASSKITCNIKWDLLRLEILLFLINLLGVAALLIGTFRTIPIMWISYALVYLKIKDKFK